MSQNPLIRLASIMPDFYDWLFQAKACPSRAMADAAYGSVEDLVLELRAANPWFDLTAWHSADVDNLLDGLLDSAQAPRSPAARWQLVGRAHMFLDFLLQAGLWTGEDVHLSHCIQRLEEQLRTPPGLDTIPLTVPEAPAAVEAVALGGLRLVARFDAFLDWIGDGRPVTATGSLRLSQIPEAAAVFGLRSARVRSMRDLPELTRPWVIARDASLISIGSTAVRQGPAAPLWRARVEDPAAALDLLRQVCAISLRTTLENGSGRAGAIRQLVLDILMAGFTDSPLPGDIAQRNVRVTADRHAETVAETVAGLSAALAAERVFATVSALEAEGFLDTSDGFFRVPDALRPLVREEVDAFARQG